MKAVDRYNCRRVIRQKPLRLLKGAMKETIKEQKITLPQQRGIFALTMGIISGGSARLVSISEKMYSQKANCVKSFVNRLTYLLRRRNISKQTAALQKSFLLKNLKKVNMYTYKKKCIAPMDWTAYRKRARKAKKNKGMQWVGKVWDGREKKPVTGYGGLITGLLLENGQMLPVTHSLYSNKYMESHPKSCLSINQIEEDAVEELKAIAGEDLIILGDRHFARKSFLYKIKKIEKQDFLMRIKQGVNITAKENGKWVNIYAQSRRIKKSYPVFWNYDKKREKCAAKVFKAGLFAPNSKKNLDVWIVVIESKSSEKKEPVILVCSFEVAAADLQDITNLYKKRWAIETAIETLKHSFGIEKVMVRKWRAIEAMIFLTLLAYALVLFIWLTSKKIILAGIFLFLRKTTILTRGKLSIDKWRYGIGILICKPFSA